MWLHCQTIPGFIGGNPFLSRSKVPMAGTETGHCHWGDALMLQPSDYSRKARRHEADFSTEERAENWRDHDHSSAPPQSQERLLNPYYWLEPDLSLTPYHRA